ncbi:PAS domain S-box protein [bacterium]|nr:PAS domain S-box protein [bacterium]
MKTVKTEPDMLRRMSDTFESADSLAVKSMPAPAAWLEGGAAVLTGSGRIVNANDKLAGWLGCPTAALVGRSFVEVLAGRRPEWENLIEQTLASDKIFDAVTLTLGEESPQVVFQLETARDRDRTFVRMNSVLPSTFELAEGAWDETLQGRKAQHAMFTRLIRAESRLDMLMRRWPGVIFSQRADFSYHFVSPQMEELTGIPATQWARQPQLFWQVIHEADAEEVRSRIQRASLVRQPMTLTYRIRHSVTGKVTYLLEHRDPVVTGNGIVLGYEGFWIDVTRQTIAERRLSTAAWKETLSVLTMGLAHDFRNLMAGIGALSEQFLHQPEADPSFRESMSLIMNNSRQASQLVHRIITLHHGKPGERNYADLNELLKEVAELTNKIIPRRITLETATHDGALPVYVDAVEFRQVVINLMLNAIDAMPDRGRLKISSTLHETLPEWKNACGTRPRVPAVALTIKDSGTGIKARHLANLFDPFFTTKALNKGSGLGLYNARLFVEKHAGGITVESTEGDGTEFHVWLPIADFTEGEREFAEGPPQRRSLLFAGAEGVAADNMVEFLRTAGYHVVTAHSCELANAMIESAEYPFAGVVVQVEDLNSGFCELLNLGAIGERRLKSILQIVGRNEDEFDSGLLRRADVLLGADLSQAAIHERLEDLFAHH